MSARGQTVVYPIPGYPTVRLATDGGEFGIRPMLPTDSAALLDFFNRIPAADRFYLKEDVTSQTVIDRWAEQLDYSRTLPMLAYKGDRIIGDGTLHRTRTPARRHVAEVRIVVDPDYRNMGVGRSLLVSLAEIAKDRDVDKLRFEIVSDVEEAARHTAQVIGFVPVAVLSGHVRDIDGTPHDLVVLELKVSDAVPSDENVL